MDCADIIRRGVAANNARAYRAKWDFPKWLFAQAVPTGNPFEVQFLTPKSAKRFLLEYVLISWPITGTFRPLFVQAYDEAGQTFVNVDFSQASTATGAKITLFSSPGVDINPALAGNQAQFVGMLAIGQEFPGNAVIGLRIYGATAAPNPANMDFLILGRQRTKQFYEEG